MAWQGGHAQHAQQLQTTDDERKKWLLQVRLMHCRGEQQRIQRIGFEPKEPCLLSKGFAMSTWPLYNRNAIHRCKKPDTMQRWAPKEDLDQRCLRGKVTALACAS